MKDNQMITSPYKTMMREPSDDIVQQELITYHRVNGCMVKTVITRKFYPGDYVDSETNIPLETKQ
jgi:hypothetical protein